MLKYLVIALIVVLLFYSPLFGTLRGRPRADSPPPKPKAPDKAESMVPCAHCGIHLPLSDALKDEQGRAYCSASHRQAGPARG